MHKPTSHFLQKYSVLPLLFFIAHTRQQHCFPFEGQCWECFTSRQLIWDTDGLGLPQDTPLAVTFCSWDSVIKLRTRTFCVLFYHHMFHGAGRHWGWPYLSGGKTVSQSTSMFSWQFRNYSPSYPICPHIPCEHYSPLLHKIWLHGQIRRRNCFPLKEYAYLCEHWHVYPSSEQYFDFLWPAWWCLPSLL